MLAHKGKRKPVWVDQKNVTARCRQRDSKFSRPMEVVQLTAGVLNAPAAGNQASLLPGKHRTLNDTISKTPPSSM